MEDFTALIDGIVRWSRRLIPDPERAERLAGDLHQFRDEAVKRPTAQPFDETMLRGVESVCHRGAAPDAGTTARCRTGRRRRRLAIGSAGCGPTSCRIRPSRRK